MIRKAMLLLLLLPVVTSVADEPRGDPFLVHQQTAARGPRITPYLQYQVQQAWTQDETRRAEFVAIRTEADLRRVQSRVREKLLQAIGGLPSSKTPLNARVVEKIQFTGYRLEKLVFESLPGVYVPAHLYVPDGPAQPGPAVLVPCGHSTNGKIHYQYICHRLAKLGYVALCWDPVGQGERSQFWDSAQKKSRYNLVCGEHAILGNLAYLAGTNIARWEIWDGIRALDYLLTRPEVDPARIAITGTSGGGFQAAHIGALDERIKVVVPSCYISSLPMRMNNRIFKDPDSDPEQDLYQMVSNGVDHAGLLLLAYPRPVFVAAAVEDFFPIEGTRQTFREISSIYRRLGHGDRIGMVEGYHRHAYSPGNLLAAFNFMNRFFGMPHIDQLPPEEKLEDRRLLCTGAGQVLLEYKDAKNLTEVIREYYIERKGRKAPGLAQVYRGEGYPSIDKWPVTRYDGAPADARIAWQPAGRTERDGLIIDKYLLHHSGNLTIPLLHIRNPAGTPEKAAMWFTLTGKATASDWGTLKELAGQGLQVFTFDFRALGEDRMMYQAASPDDPELNLKDFENAYTSPLSGVLANYVYNSLLTGRPYFLQMIEDAEIVSRFAREVHKAGPISVAGPGEAHTLATAIVACIPGTTLVTRPGDTAMAWSEVVDGKRELWPIHYLLPGGAYIK